MIKKAFEHSQAVVISGGAGSGKSRLAAEYAHQGALPGFWTAAASNVVTTMAALAPALDIKIENRPDEEVAAEVTRALVSLPSDTLWVIDNLAHLEQVNLILNAISINLLITTRDDRSQVLPSITVSFQQLPVLDPESAVKLLISRSESDPTEPALSEICELVGYLPLALELLAVRLGDYAQTPDKVLEQLVRAPTPIQFTRFQEAGGTTIGSVEGVFNTITGTLESLSEKVRMQLSPLGYIADVPIPSGFLSKIIGIEDEGLDSVIEEARLHSVISIVDSEAVVSALTIAAVAATNVDGALETTLHRGLERIISVNRDDPGALRAEIAHQERILSNSRTALELEHPDLVAFAVELAIGYGALGRFGEAVALYEEILRLRVRVLGSEHPDTLESGNNLALGFRDLGRYEEAFELDEETLRIRERVLGSEHPDTLESRSNLALSYRALGRYEEAVRLDEETLGLRGRVLGSEHPDTLRSRSNLASGYGALGRNEEAVTLIEDTLLIMDRVLGPEHPDALRSRSNLASVYDALGRFEEAVALYQEILRLRERVLGSEHLDTLESRNNLALSFRDLGRYDEAVRAFEETLPVMERVLGSVHPDTLRSRSDLAQVYRADGGITEADELDIK